MSATSAPFGLRPAFHPSGLDRAQALAGGITSGYSTAILKGQPVAYSASAGVIVPITANSTQATWSGALLVWNGLIPLVVVVFQLLARKHRVHRWFLRCLFLQRSKHRL